MILSPSPSPWGSYHGLSNLCLRDNSSEPNSQPLTLALMQIRAPTPTSTLAPKPILTHAPDQDLQPGDLDIMGRTMIVLEGVGYYPDHKTTTIILDIVGRLYDNRFYFLWCAIQYKTRVVMFNEFKSKDTDMVAKYFKRKGSARMSD